jgi:SOS-response transcriptional repressor LexA
MSCIDFDPSSPTTVRALAPKPPTPRQLEIHAWYITYQLAWGMPPTLREACHALRIASTNAMVDHLKSMTKKGLVRHRPGTTRAYLALPLLQEGSQL